MKTKLNEIFARKIQDNMYGLFLSDGSIATRIDASIYPIDSNLSTRYEHPAGIYVDLETINKFNIKTESTIEEALKDNNCESIEELESNTQVIHVDDETVIYVNY